MRIFCSICKELFTLLAEVCVTKCGHLYHENCLKLWQARSPSCPQCRAKIKGNINRVFFNTEDVELDSESDVEFLKARIDNLLETTSVLETKNKELEFFNNVLKESITEYEDKVKQNREKIITLQERVTVLNKEKEDLLPLKLMNERLTAELKRKTELDTLLKGTENEVREMLSKTPVTSLAVHQLCVYVEALKHQLKKCEEKYKYKSESNAMVMQMQKYQTTFRQSKVENAEKCFKANKTTNTLGKMLGDSEEENEVCEGNNLKRSSASSSSLKHPPALNSTVATSSNVLQSNKNKVSQKVCGKLVKKVVNNMDKTVKHNVPIDPSDVEVQVYPGPGKIKVFKSSTAAAENISIFDKLRTSDVARPDSENIGVGVVRSVCGGRRKIPLATTSQMVEMRRIHMRHKKLHLKTSKKVTNHAPCSSKS